MKKRLLVFSMALTLFILSGCAGGGIPVVPESAQPLALPTAVVSAPAPIGDAALEYQSEATLFLPRHDGARLTAMSEKIAFSAARLPAESIVRALLEHAGTGVASTVGGDVKLQLYGANPVEVSNNVATVNLAASALQLDRKAYYLACQAIANTLTELPEIEYVNVLVMDKAQSLDIGGTLPMGSFRRSVGEDVSAKYEQALSQRAAAGEDPAQKRMAAVATLYFPMVYGDGLMSETRSVSFLSQSPSDVISRLLQELSGGAREEAGATALPLLKELLTEEPKMWDLQQSGGKLIELRFDHTLDDMLSAYGVSRAGCMASLVYTLTTFLPNVTGVTIYVGDERIDSVPISSPYVNEVALLFTDGVQRRAGYAAFLLDDCRLYFACEGKLASVSRPVPFYLTKNPRYLLLALSEGPSEWDGQENLLPVMPRGALTDADILGVSLFDRQLSVNLSNAFLAAGEGLDAGEERLLAYALVNTLCVDESVRQVRFFLSGGNVPGFTAEIDWTGYFTENRGLAQE